MNTIEQASLQQNLYSKGSKSYIHVE